jgi:hypothetical protein
MGRCSPLDDRDGLVLERPEGSRRVRSGRAAASVARASRLAAFVLVATRASAAASDTAELRGTVVDPGGQPAASVRVVLLDDRGSTVRSTDSDDSGAFVIAGIAPGTYYARAERPPLESALTSVFVGSTLALEIRLALAPKASETLLVTAETEPVALATRTTLGGESLTRVPERIAGRALRTAVATTAGWATEDNGLLHLRGVDDGFLLVIDGVPLYERFDTLFGIAPEPELAASLSVMTGHLPAEYGGKAGGVIEVNTAAGFDRAFSGAVDAGGGSEGTVTVGAHLATPLGGSARFELNASGDRSDRFLDPVDPDRLHDHGAGIQADPWLRLQPSGRDTLRLGVRLGRSDFDVPNSRIQEDAGQDARQRLRLALPLGSWQRRWSAHTVSQLALLGSFTEGRLEPSPGDRPISTMADRTGRRLGVLASVTRGLDRHALKAGFEVSRLRIEEEFSFHVTDPGEGAEAELSDAALAFGAANPFLFSGRQSGTQVSAFARDTWNAGHGFVLDVGLRFDRSAFPTAETSWGPRVAVAYRASRDWAFRASVDRYFQPPQPEWLLLSSSEEARVLSPFAEEGNTGGAVPRAERQTGFEVGVERWLGRRVRVDLAAWQRNATNVSDPNVFFGTTIVFPNSVARGRARGLDLRVEAPPRREGLGGYLSYTLAKADQYGPITGGLFIEEDFAEIGPGTRFTPDHDQRHTAVAGASYRRASFWAEATGRYESGTPIEVSEESLDDLRDRPGVERVDLESGRVKPRTVLDLVAGVRLLRRDRAVLEARFMALNLTDAAYAFNFANPFSGTHFGAPRTLAASLRLSTGGSPDASTAPARP